MSTISDREVDAALATVDSRLDAAEEDDRLRRNVGTLLLERRGRVDSILKTTDAGKVVNYMRATPQPFEYIDSRLKGGRTKGTLLFNADNEIVIQYEDESGTVEFRHKLSDTREQLRAYRKARKLEPKQLGVVMANLRSRLTPKDTEMGNNAIVSTEAIVTTMQNIENEMMQLDELSFGKLTAPRMPWNTISPRGMSGRIGPSSRS